MYIEQPCVYEDESRVQALCKPSIQQPCTAALYSSPVQQPCVQNPCQSQIPHHVHEQICPSRAPTTLSRARPPTPAHPRIGEQHRRSTDAPQTLQTMHGTIGCAHPHTRAAPPASPAGPPTDSAAGLHRLHMPLFPPRLAGAVSVCVSLPGECQASTGRAI